MVIATGRSEWHVRNIAQALIYKAGGYAYVYGQVKQKQQGATRKLLPSIQGREGGKWIVVDSGKVIVHALDERARDYYDLEGLWTFKASLNAPDRDLEKTIVKVARGTTPRNPSIRYLNLISPRNLHKMFRHLESSTNTTSCNSWNNAKLVPLFSCSLL